MKNALMERAAMTCISTLPQSVMSYGSITPPSFDPLAKQLHPKAAPSFVMSHLATGGGRESCPLKNEVSDEAEIKRKIAAEK